MRAWRSRNDHDYLSDALALLQGWTKDGREIQRTLLLSDSEHAMLTEHMKVVADALQVHPEVRRLDGRTQIRVGGTETELSCGAVTLAARIEDMVRSITH